MTDRETILSSPRSEWSLSPEAVGLIFDLIDAGKTDNIIEFGSGWSSRCIAQYREIKNSTRGQFFTYENNQTYWAELINGVDVRFCSPCMSSLNHFLVEEMDRVLAESVSWNKYKSMCWADTRSIPVPGEGTFYNDNFEVFRDGLFNLMILDGPNGWGRPMAIPLLRDKLAPNAHILIDDLDDNGIRGRIEKAIDFETVAKGIKVSGKTWALVRVA